MGRKITIEVTADDIAEGIPQNCSHCPIALAVARTGIAKFINVYPGSVRLRNTMTRYGDLVLLPKNAILFIDAFDSDFGRQFVEPFSFEIEAPDVIH